MRNKLTSVFFKAPAHKARWLKIIQNLGKFDQDGRLDQEYAAALYVLTADLATWNKAQGYVGHPGIDFEDLLKEVDFSSGHGTLITLAWNLFNEGATTGEEFTKVNVVEFTNLDEANFLLAIDAIKLRCYRAYLQDFSDTAAKLEDETENAHMAYAGVSQANEQILKEIIEELRQRKLAVIPSSAARLIKQRNLPFVGDYSQLSALFWQIVNDPEAERAYKRIIESDK